MGRGLALALYINRLRFSWSTQQDGFSAGLRCMILAKGRVAAYYTAPDMTAEYCDKRVCMCLCVCPRPYLRNDASDLHLFFVNATYGRGSVLF